VEPWIFSAQVEEDQVKDLALLLFTCTGACNERIQGVMAAYELLSHHDCEPASAPAPSTPSQTACPTGITGSSCTLCGKTQADYPTFWICIHTHPKGEPLSFFVCLSHHKEERSDDNLLQSKGWTDPVGTVVEPKLFPWCHSNASSGGVHFCGTDTKSLTSLWPFIVPRITMNSP
jgi:hypothetical protein